MAIPLSSHFVRPGVASLNVPPNVQQEAMRAARARRRRRTIFGRYTGPQLWHSEDITGNFATPTGARIINKQLTLEKPHERLQIILRFRMAITVADMTSTLPEAPQNILTSFRMWGNAGAFGAQTMYQASGATLFMLPHVYPGSDNGSYVEINGVRMVPGGVPFQSMLPTAQGNYDIEICWQLPTAPYFGLGTDARRQKPRFWLSPQDWGNTIQVEIGWGDATSMGTVGPATVAFSGYGGAGSPSVQFFQNFALLGQGEERMFTRNNALVLRVERPITTLTAQATQTQMAYLEQRVTTNVLVKSGTSVASGGGTAFATLSNTQLDETRIVRGTTPVRYNQSNRSYRAYYADEFGLSGPLPEGYLPISFIEEQELLNAYRGDALEGGSNFFLYTDVDNANAANYQTIMQEQIVQSNAGGPFAPVVAG